MSFDVCMYLRNHHLNRDYKRSQYSLYPKVSLCRFVNPSLDHPMTQSPVLLLFVTRDEFAFFRLFCKRNCNLCDLYLASFSQKTCSEIHPCGGRCTEVTPVHG